METAASRTALRVAIRRALHQVCDSRPLVLDDPIAVPILGRTYRPALEGAAASVHDRFSIAMRSWFVARSRYAEDQLFQAVQRGVRQYVVLGAGLDTFAHRNPYPHLKMFEVDHPATQEWKCRLLQSNGMPKPSRLEYVPVDFERQNLAHQLENSGVDFTAPAVFSWLGVVMYLTYQAFRATLDFVAAFPASSGIIMDYALPRHALSLREAQVRDLLAARVQKLGEPFQLFFTPVDIAAELTSFQAIEDLDSRKLNARYFMSRTDQLSLVGQSGHILSAWL